jgi:hypothetical protein
MQSEFVGIIRALALTHPEVDALRQQSLAACATNADPVELLENFEADERDSGVCQEYQAFSALCKASLLAGNDDLDGAINEANKALEEFRFCGNSFNEGLSHRFFGLIYFQQDKENQAISELARAKKIFKSCVQTYAAESKYARKADAEKQIFECDKLIERIKNPSADAGASDRPASKGFSKKSWPTASMVYGVYDVGHASKVGRFVLEDDQISEMSIEDVRFDDKKHKIYNLHIGSQIRLHPSGEYRWLRVVGNSMNRATPIPIDPEDYVLVDFKVNPQPGNIIFASFCNPPTPAERAGVIKRLSGEGLRSESSEIIEPIPMEDVELRGVVLAIAKPEEETPPASRQSAPTPRKRKRSPGQTQTDAADEKSLLNDLLTLARADQELVERLIHYEIEQSPAITRREAIQRAILHWRREL